MDMLGSPKLTFFTVSPSTASTSNFFGPPRRGLFTAVNPWRFFAAAIFSAFVRAMLLLLRGLRGLLKRLRGGRALAAYLAHLLARPSSDALTLRVDVGV